ncbi:MAG TPA: ATP-dependent Clp protease ATP-binding subunit ClpA [Pyrinomonadaceae bacterium]|jgi:ATP-dependent Clp protease ATP-binding subunit ClpA|nr:ATP-dependent Clp protease ATP-binding subunit ClpA [Pyrinomonadaceae bacterium]
MITKELENTLNLAVAEATTRQHEYVTLEHLLLALLNDPTARDVIYYCGGNLDALKKDIEEFFAAHSEMVNADPSTLPEQTIAFQRVLQYALLQAQASERQEVNGGGVLAALFHAQHSHAVFLLNKHGITRLAVLKYISHGISPVGEEHAAGDVNADEDDGETRPSRDPLKAFTVDLIERAAAGQIDPLIGRNDELQRTIQVLCRRRKNNPVYVGEPGVGKTAIAEGLALKIHLGEVPEMLRSATVYALDMGAVLAGTKYRGEFEQRFKGVINALKKISGSILFIDEIHTIVGAGAVSGGSMDASNILKPALASGELRCIGSTTYSEYKASFERDRALARRFQKIEVSETSVEETVGILNGLKSYYEEYHGVKYSPDAIRVAAEMSAKYMHDRFLPDKAIDVIDEAGAALKLKSTLGKTKLVRTRDIETVVARMAKVPAKTVVSSEKVRLGELQSKLQGVIFGQVHAIEQVVRAIKLSRSGLGQPEKPVGCFLFSGPTGVGKTELAKQIAVILGVEFIRFDMSEYAESHTVSRLIGAPPGYVGFDQGGLLTDAINRTPYAVLVLDEIEKAHPNLFNILLQVMDHATLTDNNGKKADFRNVILIMTTNAGGREISEGGIGFQKDQGKGQGRGAIERTFSPEFRNRLDAWIAFKPLDAQVIEQIVDKFIDELNQQLREKKVAVKLSPEARSWLAQRGFNRLLGARPMARLIQAKIKEPLAEKILFGRESITGDVLVELEKDALSLRFPER